MRLNIHYEYWNQFYLWTYVLPWSEGSSECLILSLWVLFSYGPFLNLLHTANALNCRWDLCTVQIQAFSLEKIPNLYTHLCIYTLGKCKGEVAGVSVMRTEAIMLLW